MKEKLQRLMKDEGLTSLPRFWKSNRPAFPICYPDATNPDSICCKKFCVGSRGSIPTGCCSTPIKCTVPNLLQKHRRPVLWRPSAHEPPIRTNRICSQRLLGPIFGRKPTENPTRRSERANRRRLQSADSSAATWSESCCFTATTRSTVS